jgi:predicted dithiol-disulfide oxidoreductase (DUF899 family)
MTRHRIGTREEWLDARLALLASEKELTRRSDQLARQRRELPWVPVETEYVFDTEDGPATLTELFDGRGQLLVYHFMFGPDWTEGCPACSLWADSFDRSIVHLNQRDVTLVCVSRAPLGALAAYRARMGWSFRWVSSLTSPFSVDFGASFPPGVDGGARHNFTQPPQGPEHAGLSAFVLDGGGVHHTYSCFARGLEAFNVAYGLLDRAPRGRDEDALVPRHAWLRRHDEYDGGAEGTPGAGA